MKTQQELDRWINACIKYYNNNSKTIEMKTTDERVQQLEQAHSRLFNQFNTFHQDFIQHRQVLLDEIELLKDIIKNLQPKDEKEVAALPEDMKAGAEYVAVISNILKSKATKWHDMDYTNWELKLEGKPDYVYVAFIPTSYQLQIGDKVRFTYAHPFLLKKLKQVK